MDTEFIDATDHHRYELRAGEELVGSIVYRLHGETIRLIHTEVPPEHAGKGYASTLARAALDDARARGLTVRPDCPYVAAYVAKHPEYADLVA